MEKFWRDARYTLRMLTKAPGFTGVAVLTLALGIGANATIFSVVNAVLFSPLPFPDADRLVLLWETNGSEPDNLNIVSWPNFLDWKQQADVLEGLALFDSAGRGYNLSGNGEPEQVSGVRVSASFFDVLGVKPRLGRSFLPDEETRGKGKVVVLSDGLWRRRYGADPGLVGKTIRMDGEAFTVIGVMPPDFKFQFWGGQRQLWVPIELTKGDLERGSHSFVVFGRLKSKVTLEQAAAQMDSIGRALAREHPKENIGKSATAVSMANFGKKNLRPVLLALLAVVGLVLLIACANVANLVLARGASRQKELAIRGAMGASRFRIARQLLTESVLLALIGGAAGVLIAFWTSSLLMQILPSNFRYVPFRSLEGQFIDWNVIAFTWAVSCLTGVLFGLAPALSVFRSDVNTILKEGGRGSTQGAGLRLRNCLVASEMGLALIVLTGAGLMIQSMSRLLSVDPGLDSKNLLTLEMSLPQENLYYGPPTLTHFSRDLLSRVGSIAGVVSVSAVGHLPLGGGGAGRGFTIEGRPDPGPENQAGAGYSVACPNYFHTMGIPLVSGREFTDRDTANSEGVIVINQTMAKRYWPDEDPVGRRIKLGHFDSKEPWLTIVGVSRDVRHFSLDEPPSSEFLRPYDQAAWPFMTVVVRTSTSPMALERPVKEALLEIAPDRPVSSVATMAEVVSESVGPRRFPMLLLSVFATLAVLLAAVGISGVVNYTVAQRTHEIGIRMALGASGRDVVKAVLGRSLLYALVGICLGVGGSMALSRFIEGLLFEVKPIDPLVLGVVSTLLTGVSVFASYLPARKATRVDPMIALRYE
jgi:predicted permease